MSGRRRLDGASVALVEELLGTIEAWRDEGLGTCPGIERTNYPDAMDDIIALAEKVRAQRARALLDRA